MIRILFLLLCFTSIFASPLFGKTKLDSLLVELDRTIQTEKQYTIQKEENINGIKLRLNNPNLPDTDKYQLYTDLIQEYKAFIYDSAKAYSQKALSIAEKSNNKEWIQDSKIQYAATQSQSGMFNKTIDILDSVDKSVLSETELALYYKTYIDTYIYWMEYQDDDDSGTMEAYKKKYQDSLLQILPPNTFEYAINFGTKYIESGELSKAEELLSSYYPYLKPYTRNYAIFTSIQAYLYEKKGDLEKQKEYLAMSAISDIRAAVKENVSLRTLALRLFKDGNTNRANSYIKKSLEDANFFNARLRNIQTAKLLPIIDKAYQLDRENQQEKLRILLITVSLLSLILLVAIYFVVKQMKKLSKAQRQILEINARLNELNDTLKTANEEQRETNVSLKEANHIKEQFIRSFLEICTEYIDKLDAFKITVNRKIKAGQTADLLKITSSSEDSVRELKELYSNFDKAFLNIYPNFVSELNKLLRPEERYAVVAGEKTLNHELRVFALIKLGITDNNKIATFLHYTLRTIYNYRSKVKSKALNADEDFEERIKHICDYIS